jgi:nucleoside-diphosphate-sugar epimerase
VKAVVTGVAGFVGSHLARRLLADGHQVIGIDALTDYYDVNIKKQNLSEIPDGDFSFYFGNINNIDLSAILNGAEWIFHQAGQPGVRQSWGSDFSIYVRENIAATQKLLEAAKACSTLRRLVYASSSSIYGNAERYPTSETARPQPVSPYGVTKLAAEHLCTLYAQNFGLPTVSLRYFTVYGPSQRPDMAFTRFVRAALLDEVITVYGSGNQVRDFTYVDDIVRANIAVAAKDVPPGSVFNIAGGSNLSVNEALATLAALAARPLRIDYRTAAAGDVFRTGADTTKIEEAVGWKASVPVEEGLAKHFDWGMETFGALALT